jgi:uncharacterized protein DUF4129
MRAQSWRTVAAIGALLGLVAVVAVAAAGRSPAGGKGRVSAHAPGFVADYVATGFLLVMLLGVPLVLFSLASHRAERVRQGKSTNWASLIVGLALLAVVVLALTHGPLANRFGRDPNTGGTAAKPTKPKAHKKKPSRPDPANTYEPRLRWVPVFVVGSLILGIGGAMAVFAVRRKREELREIPVALALSEVLAESLDDLRREVDPRRAVIRAYSRMERTLAASGLPKRRTEAPFEYLARVLGSADVSSHSVQRLTQLFQRARFSTHAIDAGMKEDAIAALSGLRAELEAGR